MSLTVNVLAASLALGGFVGYVRRLHDMAQTSHDAEHRYRWRRGSDAAAGRLGRRPAGRCPWTAIYLFAIVFYWTPPHFWALSILMKNEYAEVGVPMLPVVRGEAETRKQILLYSGLLYAVTELPFCAGGFGVIYLVGSMVLGLVFLAYAWRPVPARRSHLRGTHVPLLDALSGVVLFAP